MNVFFLEEFYGLQDYLEDVIKDKDKMTNKQLMEHLIFVANKINYLSSEYL